MKDIARDLGVSVVTISKVLRNHSDIGPETRRKVLKRMKELKYEPNLAARALVTGRTNMAGLIVPDLTHAFFGEVAKGISIVLRNHGYGLAIASSEEEPDLEKQEIERMLSRRFDVLIIASTQWTVESFRGIEERQRPYVLIDRSFTGLPANFVGTNDHEVGEMATRHLIEQGRRRIAYIGGQYVSSAVDRLEGYRRALLSSGLPFDESYAIRRSHTDDSADLTGYQAANQLLRMSPRPDAIFCFNDPVALGAMKAVLQAGLRIPADIAIIGCGNARYADSLRVPLSSVDQGSKSIGEAAATLALKLIDNKSTHKPEQVLIPPRLIVRESTAKVSAVRRRSKA